MSRGNGSNSQRRSSWQSCQRRPVSKTKPRVPKSSSRFVKWFSRRPNPRNQGHPALFGNQFVCHRGELRHLRHLLLLHHHHQRTHAPLSWPILGLISSDAVSRTPKSYFIYTLSQPFSLDQYTL